jgi:hypothetical protein
VKLFFAERFYGWIDRKGPTNAFSAGPCTILGVLFLCWVYNLLWTHGSIVDADVVDQAGKEGSGFLGLAGVEIEAIN